MSALKSLIPWLPLPTYIHAHFGSNSNRQHSLVNHKLKSFCFRMNKKTIICLIDIKKMYKISHRKTYKFVFFGLQIFTFPVLLHDQYLFLTFYYWQLYFFLLFYHFSCMILSDEETNLKDEMITEQTSETGGGKKVCNLFQISYWAGKLGFLRSWVICCKLFLKKMF